MGQGLDDLSEVQRGKLLICLLQKSNQPRYSLTQMPPIRQAMEAKWGFSHYSACLPSFPISCFLEQGPRNGLRDVCPVLEGQDDLLVTHD